jgi:lipopolysaccharide transport system permease protein
VDFLVGFIVLIIVSLLLGLTVPLNILAAPLIISLVIGLALSIGMAAAALGAYYRDFAYALPFVLQVWLYATPVLYSPELIPSDLRPFLGLNPLVALVEAFRWSVLGTPFPPVTDIAAGLLTGTILAAASVLLFTRIQRNMTDVV